MNNNLVGEQITKYRKAAGLTQEDLGRAVGVSTQAVSRWECGGTPDVSLLPVIADKLGVTIDSLFGREERIPENITDQVCRYITSLPAGKRLDTLCRMLYRCIQHFISPEFRSAPIGYSEQCTMQTAGESALLRSGAMLEEGMMFGIGSEELSFMSIFPEPESGWADFLLDNDDYRKLFAALALPNALELLEMLYSEKAHYIVPEAAACRLGIPTPKAEEIFARLFETHLLHRLELELVSGMIYTYTVNENYAYIPFLLIARCLIENNGYYYIQWFERESPLLRKPRGRK